MMKLLLLVMVVCTGCATMPRAVEPAAALGERSVTIHVGDHGKHTGIILPSEYVYAELPAIKERFGEVRYLEIGWGDAGFYQANEITSGLAMRAMFTLTDTVVHVVGFSDDPAYYFMNSKIEKVEIDEAQMGTLIAFVSNSLERDENGDIISLKEGIYGDSQFYSGVGSYYALNTCNNWTAKALYSGGLRISPTLRFTSGSVMRGLKGARR